MSGPGPWTVSATGSLVQPATLAPTVASALTSLLLSEIGKIDTIAFPAIHAVGICNGYDLQCHLIDGAEYTTGPLAPYTAPTMTSTGAKATATYSPGGNPAANDYIAIGGSPGNRVVYFVATLDTTGTFLWDQVLRNATPATTIVNLQKFMEGTYTPGTEAYGRGPSGIVDMHAVCDVEVTGVTGGATPTASFRARTPGAGGNTYLATVVGLGTFGTAGYMTGGATGTGTAPLQGNYDWVYAYVRKADSCQTAVSHDASLSTTSACNATAASLQAPASMDGIDLYRLFRTTTVGGIFYRDADSASSPITDSVLDATLVLDETGIYDASIVRPYEDGRPTKYRFHAEHDGGVFGAGAVLSAKQSAGTAAVVNYDGTNAATALVVTLTGSVYPKTAWIGRTFRASADELKYGVVGVNEATKALTLNTPYTGATNATTTYEVTDARDPFALPYCEPLLLNNWPPENEVDGLTANDARGVTGLRSVYGTLLAWTMDGTYRVLGDNATGFRLLAESGSNGAWCNQAVQDIDGRVVWLGPDGTFSWGHPMYRTAGWGLYGEPVNVSRPPIAQPGDDPTGIQATIKRINPLAADGIVSDYNPSLKLVRWFVPVDGSPWNNFVIVFSAQTGAFTFGTCDAVTSALSVIGPDGLYVTLCGDMYGNLWQMDLGTSDGAWGFECVQAVSSYAVATNKLTVAGTPFPTASGGLSGVPVYAIEALTGIVKRNTVASNTPSVLTMVNGNWVYPDGTVGSVPAAADQIVVGGIYAHGKTSMFSMEMPEIRKTVSSVTSQFMKATAGQMWVAVGVDNADPTIFTLLEGTADAADLTAAKGTKYGEMRRGPGRLVQIEWWTIAPGFDFQLVALDATIRTRDEVPR